MLHQPSQDRGAGTPAFAVMSAFHLVGPDGVVRKLQARGYRVQEVLTSDN